MGKNKSLIKGFDFRFQNEDQIWHCPDPRDFGDDFGTDYDKNTDRHDSEISSMKISITSDSNVNKLRKGKMASSGNDLPCDEVLEEAVKRNVNNKTDEGEEKISETEKKLPIYKLAEIVAKKNTIALFDNVPYAYDKNIREYRPLVKNGDSSVLRNMIQEPYRGCINRYSVPDFIEWLKVDENILKVTESDLKERAVSLVNFSNTAVWIDSLEPALSGRNQYFRRHIFAEYPVDYEPMGVYFERYLEVTFGDDLQARRLFQEVLGYCLGDFRGAKKAFLFYGPSNTGKSVAGNLMRKLVGGEFTESLTLSDLHGQFSVARLYGKFLNIGSEIDTSSRASGSLFKRLVGNDEVAGDVKFQPGINFVNTAAMVFLANTFPRFSLRENANSIAERFVIVPFLNVVDRHDWIQDLDEKIFAEADYVVKFAMEGLRRLKRNNFLFSQCQTSDRLLKEYLIEAFPENQFVRTFLVADPNGKVATAELDRLYRAFCTSYDLPSPGKTPWFSILTEEFRVKRTRGIHYGENHDARGFSGVSFKK